MSCSAHVQCRAWIDPVATIAPRSRAEMFEAVVGGIDPALMSEAAERCATALVRGTGPGDDDVVRRLITLADSEGLDSLAQVWSHAPADSIAGALWRLYLLRTFVYNSPNQASAEYAGGHQSRGR